jgi:hypothetical protein
LGNQQDGAVMSTMQRSKRQIAKALVEGDEIQDLTNHKQTWICKMKHKTKLTLNIKYKTTFKTLTLKYTITRYMPT